MKICTQCQKEKTLKEFNKRSASKDGLASLCKECNKSKLKEHYNNNKEYYVLKAAKRNKDQKLINRQYIYDYLKTKSCLDCGECDPILLEFDHVRGEKYNNVSHLVGKGWSIDTIQKEIDKCEVVCSNCHRKRTAKVFGWYKDLI